MALEKLQEDFLTELYGTADHNADLDIDDVLKVPAEERPAFVQVRSVKET